MAHRILIVEDDSVTQSFSKNALEEVGFTVDVCESIKEAADILDKKQFDLVLLDIGLPDGSGFEVCRKLKSGKSSAAPFIFLTAIGDIKTRLEGFKLGGQDYIQKPFAIEELLARINVHLKLKRKQDVLMRRNYDLKIRDRLRQDLTDMILHDLRAPISSIKGSLELVVSNGLIHESAAVMLLRQAETAADFMLLTVNDLLDLSQAGQIGLRPEVSEVDLAAFFRKIADLFETRCQRKEMPINIAYSGRPHALKTDLSLLFRVMVNLISNAMDFSRPGQQIDVVCEPRGINEVRLAVGDRGPGVSDEMKQRIFEKYVSSPGEDKAENARSNGIGLAFCRLALDALKGRIWVEDRPGGGSLFICEIPLKIEGALEQAHY